MNFLRPFKKKKKTEQSHACFFGDEMIKELPLFYFIGMPNRKLSHKIVSHNSTAVTQISNKILIVDKSFSDLIMLESSIQDHHYGHFFYTKIKTFNSNKKKMHLLNANHWKC